MKNKIEFTSCMSRRERGFALLYLPVHVLLLPFLLSFLYNWGLIDITELNLLCYAIGALLMLLFQRRFLWREFKSLEANFPAVVLSVCLSYGVMLLCNLAVVFIFRLNSLENPNNAGVFAMAAEEYWKVFVMSVLFAPLVEELMFRGGVFGLLRQRSRLLAYAVTVLLFAFYHVWSYLAQDTGNWVYLLQYLPIGVLLCRCYERTNSLWTSVLLHMCVNAISLQSVKAMEALL